MRRLALPKLIAGTLIGAIQCAGAATATFVANLSGANEVPPTNVPPVNSAGTGTATVVLDTRAQTLQVSATFSGLTTPDAAAHIHCCAPLGTNVGVATMLPAFTGFPLGVTSGVYAPRTFDLTQASFYNPAFITSKGGLVANAEAALIAGLLGGETYFNIHTTLVPSGEIRGQLSLVPLPGALPLFATGLGALGLLGWRRKKKLAA
jgi:CHRD domain